MVKAPGRKVMTTSRLPESIMRGRFGLRLFLSKLIKKFMNILNMEYTDIFRVCL